MEASQIAPVKDKVQHMKQVRPGRPIAANVTMPVLTYDFTSIPYHGWSGSRLQSFGPGDALFLAVQIHHQP